MKLTFLGTRGLIEPKNRRHRMHSSLLAAYRGKEVMVDCGETWLGRLKEISPRAVVLTHAHPDHAFGLKDGAPCPVYGTRECWNKKELNEYPIDDRRVLNPREPKVIEGISFEAFEVLHSTRAPAVGYRISAGRVTVFYVPDVVYIQERSDALSGARAYIGDGATITRSMVRRSSGTLIGHAPVRTQLTWCGKEGVPKMYVTHCGSEIVKGDERKLGAELRNMAAERGVKKVTIAGDGMKLILR